MRPLLVWWGARCVQAPRKRYTPPPAGGPYADPTTLGQTQGGPNAGQTHHTMGVRGGATMMVHRGGSLLLALVSLAFFSGSGHACFCCMSAPCPYKSPKGQLSGCWAGDDDLTSSSLNASSRSNLVDSSASGQHSQAASASSKMGWYSPSSTLSTEFDEGLCLVAPDSSLPGGIRSCIAHDSVMGPSESCSRAWETNALQEVNGVVQSSVSFRGKVGQMLFGLHNVGAGAVGADVGATKWQFTFCADSSGLFAGVAGDWDTTFRLVRKAPPSHSDVLKIAFNKQTKTASYFVNGDKLHEATWASIVPPYNAGEPAQFFAHVALESNGEGGPGERGGAPYTGKPNDKNFLDGAVCSLRGDDGWQVDGSAWIFVSGVLVSSGAYLAGGILLAKSTTTAVDGGGTTVVGRTLRRHPHWAHWSALGALVTDGVFFLAALGRGQRRPSAERGAALLDSEAEGSGGRRGSSHSTSSKRSSGSAKSSKSRKGSKSSKSGSPKVKKASKNTNASTGAGDSPPPPPAAPPPINLGRQKTSMTDAFGRVLSR